MKALHLLITSSLIWAGSTFSAQAASNDQNDDVAIIIGNKTYVDQDIPEVSFAHNDAKAMRRFAEDVLNIRKENIIYIEDASQAKMQTAFGREGNYRGKAFQYVKPDVSNLYVFYSGHGLPGQHDQRSYLLPVDAEIETADINGYPIDVLYENLSKVDAKSVTVFLDACFSGSSHGGTLIKSASGAQILPVEQKNQSSQNGNMTILTAASSDQLASWDEESKHGLFTEYLMRALYGEADRDEDGEIRLDEVRAFLNEDMRYKARRTYNRDQIPTISGDGNLIMAKAVDGSFLDRPSGYIDAPSIDVDSYPLTPVEENMFAVKNANVRSEPTVRSRKVDMIPKGEPIHVAAKVTDQPWYAVERGDDIIGYIFADLLGEEKEIATEEENRFIRDLKARLEKLEEQTRLSSKDVLPPPPKQTASNSQQDTKIEEPSREDMVKWSNPHVGRYQRIESTLKSMGAILNRQSFIKRDRGSKQETSFKYNWVQVEAGQCKIMASVSLIHDAKSIYMHDRQIQARFFNPLKQKKRTLKTKNYNGRVVMEATIYRYGPFAFKSKQDRKLFIEKAREAYRLCPQPPSGAKDRDTSFNTTIYERRPKPPGLRKPPPPRRN